MDDKVVELFELTEQQSEVKMVEEWHYRLIPVKKIDGEAIRNYTD